MAGLVITSRVVGRNVLDQEEDRARMVCAVCDFRLYIAVLPVEQADKIHRAIEVQHLRDCPQWIGGVDEPSPPAAEA